MIITIREPNEAEMREYLLRYGWREDKSAARVRGDEHWIACNQTEKHSLDIYSAFIEAARTAIERAVFISTAATPLSDVERAYGEENVVQKAGAAQAAIEVATEQLTMPDAPAAGPKTVLIKSRAAIKKARLASAAAQGGLW